MKTYGAITPARDEENFLPGLISSMLSQTRMPLRWIVIDDGSVDSTARLLDDLASRHKWVNVHHVPSGGERQPGGESALQRFLSPQLWSDCDVIFRVDADISFEPDFVNAMLVEFRRDSAWVSPAEHCTSSDGANGRKCGCRGFTPAARSRCTRGTA